MIGNFYRPRVVGITGYTGCAMEPFISKDGKFLFYNNRNGEGDNTNIFYAMKISDDQFCHLGEVRGINTGAIEGVPSMDNLGNFYFTSTRSYLNDMESLYCGLFCYGTVVNLSQVKGMSKKEMGCCITDTEISCDGNELLFTEVKFPGPSTARIGVAEKQWNKKFLENVTKTELLKEINSEGLNYAPTQTVDGLEMLWTRRFPSTLPKIMRSTRTSRNEPFGQGVWQQAVGGFCEAPSLSADGRTCYFHKMIGEKNYGLFVMDRNWLTK